MVLGKAYGDAGTPVVSDQGNLIYAQGVEQRRKVARHVPLIIPVGGRLGLAIAAQVWHYHTGQFARHRDLKAPGKIGLGKAM